MGQYPTPRVAAAALFKALSDEARLRLLRTLAHSRENLRERSVVPLFGLSQSTVSHHLKVLRTVDIVDARNGECGSAVG